MTVDDGLKDVAPGHHHAAGLHVHVDLAPGRADDAMDAAQPGPPAGRRHRRRAYPVGLGAHGGEAEHEVAGREGAETDRLQRRLCRGVGARHQEPPVAGDAHTAGVDLAGVKTEQVVEDDEVGEPAGGDQPEVGPPEPIGGVVGGGADGPGGRHTVGDQPPHEMVDAALAKQGAGEQVIGAQHQVCRQLREGGQVGDDLGQQAVDHPPQLHRQPGPQAGQDVALEEDLVVGLDAGAEVGLELGRAQAGGMARYQLAAVEAGLDYAHHAVVGTQHPEHVHHLGQAPHLGPGQHQGDIAGVQVVAGKLETGLGRHARWRLDDEPDGQAPAGLHGIAHTVDPRHVGQLVGVAKDRGGAPGGDGGGVGARRQHRALEVDVHVDEPGGDVGAGAVDHLGGIVTAAGRVDAGDQLADHAHIGEAQLSRAHVHHPAPAQQQVKGLVAQGRPNGSGPHTGVYLVSHARDPRVCRPLALRERRPVHQLFT